jgi:DNA-binding beta-propeller fold protein YncE
MMLVRFCMKRFPTAAVLVLASLSFGAQIAVPPKPTPSPAGNPPTAPTPASPTGTPPSATPSTQSLAPVPSPPLPPATVRNVPPGTFKMELPMIQRNVIRDITGRMGGMAMDIEKNILYVAAAAANNIEVHNVANSKAIQTLSEQPAPTNLVFMQTERLLVASCASDSTCRVFKADDSGQLSFQRALSFSGETNPLVLDPDGKRCWVGHGVFISSFDPADGTRKSEISLDGIGRPVAMVIPATGPRLYAITSPANDVVVIDREQGAVEARWPLSERAPSAIALDDGNKRLFVATRTPAKLLVLDLETGREVAKVDAPDEPGSMWYDLYIRKLYIAGNRGKVQVFAQVTPDVYQSLAIEDTAAGARTSLLIPEHRRLIIAAPNLGGEEAARLFIYQIGK